MLWKGHGVASCLRVIACCMFAVLAAALFAPALLPLGVSCPGAVRAAAFAEEAAADIDEVKALIAVLKADPDEITEADREDIERAGQAYAALSADDQALLDEEIYSKNQTYGRWLESAEWALLALTSMDSTANLADGDYSALASSTCDMGKSTSARSREWTVAKLVVANGKFTALVRCDGVSAFRNMRVGGVDYAAGLVDGVPEFEVPFKVNEPVYITVDANELADSIVYRLQVVLDTSTAGDGAIEAARSAAQSAQAKAGGDVAVAVAASSLLALADKPGVTGAELQVAQSTLAAALAAASGSSGGGGKTGGRKGGSSAKTSSKSSSRSKGASSGSTSSSSSTASTSQTEQEGSTNSSGGTSTQQAGSSSSSGEGARDDAAGSDSDGTGTEPDAGVASSGDDADEPEGSAVSAVAAQAMPLQSQQGSGAFAGLFIGLAAAILFLAGMLARTVLFVRGMDNPGGAQ